MVEPNDAGPTSDGLMMIISQPISRADQPSFRALSLRLSPGACYATTQTAVHAAEIHRATLCQVTAHQANLRRAMHKSSVRSFPSAWEPCSSSGISARLAAL